MFICRSKYNENLSIFLAHHTDSRPESAACRLRSCNNVCMLISCRYYVGARNVGVGRASMRSASTVSGPLLSVSTPASQQNRFAAVHLLTGQLLYFIVEVSVKWRLLRMRRRRRKIRKKKRLNTERYDMEL